MSLVIYTAHSGGYLQADGNSFASIDELRKFIEQQTRLPPSCQILMTSRGTNLRPASFNNERELYLYDRKQLELNAKPLLEPTPKLPTLRNFPDDLDNETDITSWRQLFKKRKQWAETVVTHAEHLAAKTRDADAATTIILRAVGVAFANLEAHSKGLDESLRGLRDWAEGVLQDRERILTKWEPAVQRLVRIPVHEEFKRYGEGLRGGRKVNMLSDFVEVKEVQKAGAVAVGSAERFEKDVVELGGTIEDICERTKVLKEEVATASRGRGDVAEELKTLRAEVEIFVDKVKQDHEYARGLQGPKAAAMASKRAYAATSETLPALANVIEDMGKLLLRTVERKNAVSATCLDHLQHIAVIQSVSAPINAQINKLDATYGQEDPHFELLSLILRLPNLYGSLLIECVRRREWSEKFSASSQRLAEELALMKEDEEKRRRKWQRSTGALLPFELGDTSQVVRAELNTRGDPSGGLPQVQRKDIESYIQTLKAHDEMSDTIKELTQALNDLDKPNKRINKRLKGFKLGSVHEANMMSSSFLGANDSEEIKTLRSEKATQGERIKGYESRIRKLEDLLHRGRSSTGNVYNANASTPQPSGTPIIGTPSQDQINGRPMSHRRTSSEAVHDPLTLRISALETELASERDRNIQLQKQATEKVESEKEMTARITQADDTKRDLVANLEALGQQHNLERKALEIEIGELKVKLDEAYEELDRFEENKSKDLGTIASEMEKMKEDHKKEVERITKELKEQSDSKLQEELERQTKRADEETQRADEAEASLGASEKATSRLVENLASLEKQLKETRESLEKERQTHTVGQETLIKSMKLAHSHLSSEPPTEDPTALMSAIEILVAQSITLNKEMSELLTQEKEKAKAAEQDKQLIQQRFDARTIRAKDLTQRLYTHNARSVQLLETLGYRVVRGDGPMQIIKVSRSSSTTADSTMLPPSDPASAPSTAVDFPRRSSLANTSTPEDINLLYWMETPDSDTENMQYSAYLRTIGALDLDAFSETLIARIKKCESDARSMMKHSRAYREKYYRSRDEASNKIAFKSFKPGDLALFLPTRNQVTRPWAAFNVGAPHFFLREQESHKLASRDWLLARITHVEEKIVDLSRSRASMNLLPRAGTSITSSTPSLDDDNPFELSDGLRWYMLDAVEEKPGAPSTAHPGAPSTPGLATSTVAAANVDARGSLKSRKPVSGAKKKLSEITTEHSRRSSGASNRGSAALSVADVAAVRAAVAIHAGSPESVAVESVPGTPRTPVEKVSAAAAQAQERSRAASFRGAGAN